MQPPRLHSSPFRLRPSVSGAFATGVTGLTDALASPKPVTRCCAGLCPVSCAGAPTAGRANREIAKVKTRAIGFLVEALILISCRAEGVVCRPSLLLQLRHRRRSTFALRSSCLGDFEWKEFIPRFVRDFAAVKNSAKPSSRRGDEADL